MYCSTLLVEFLLVPCLLDAISLILRYISCCAGIGVATASQTIISRVLHANICKGEVDFEVVQVILLPFPLVCEIGILFIQKFMSFGC